MKHLIIIIAVFASLQLFGQNKFTSEGEARTRVTLSEKQNRDVSNIPSILLHAFCNGDIDGYYPTDYKTRVSYPQFLYHFGMDDRATVAQANDYPVWFDCEPRKCVKVDPYVMTCLKYEFEIGEENYFNRTTSRQEKKINYIKIIYSYECSTRGIETEGPVFRMQDIKKLDRQKYKIPNSNNLAASLSVWDVITLGNFKRTTVYKKGEFVERPDKTDKDILDKRTEKETENWDQ